MWCADGECYVVAAAAAGAARNPAWYHNLMAHPAVPIEVGNRVLDATARVAIGTGRDRLFNRFAPEPPTARLLSNQDQPPSPNDRPRPGTRA